jgi:hypothetical protein
MRFSLSTFLIRLYPPGVFLLTRMLHSLLRGSVDKESLLNRFLVNSGLDRCDLHDRQAIRKVLARRFRNTSPKAVATYIGQLGMLLHLRGDSDASLAVIESFLGIEPGDYPDRDRSSVVILSEKLAKCLRDVDNTTACMFVMSFVNVCAHVESRGGYAGNAVIEAFFGLASEDYSLDRLTEKLGPRLAGLDDMLMMMVLGGLSVSLLGTGRTSEAQMLIRWFFDLADADLADASRLRGRVRQRLAAFRPEARTLIVHLVPQVLHPLLKPEVVIHLIEDLFEIGPDLYESPERLAEKLGLGTSSEVALVAALALNEALQYSRQFEKSRVVLRAIATNEGGAPTDTAELLERLPGVIKRIEKHLGPAFFKLVMDNLFRSKELPAAAGFLEGLLGIAPDDYSAGAPRIAARIRDAGLGFSPEEDAILILQLTGVLIDTEGREDHALLLLDAYLWQVLDLSELSVTKPAAVQIVCHLLQTWLEWSPSDRAYPRCGAIVGYLRDCLDLRGVFLEDRSRFVRDLAAVRRRIVQIGRDQAWSDEGRWRDVLCWDVELGQRLLLERYRFLDGDGAPLRVDPAHPREEGLKRGWSLKRKRPSSERTRDEDGTYASSQQPFCFGYGRETTTQPESKRDPVPGEPSTRFTEVEHTLRQGVTPETIAGVVGPSAILLRCGFLPSGRLYWDAFRSDGQQISRIGGGLSPDDRARAEIAAAVAWHDRFLASIWAENGQRDQPLRAFARAARLPLNEIVGRLTSRRGAPTPEPGSLARLSNQVLEVCSRYHGESWLAGWIKRAIPTDWESALTRERGPLVDPWMRMGAILAAIGEGELVRGLDLITSELLESVAAHLDLRDLGRQMDAETDVIVEVEGPMHAIPIPLIRLGVRRFFEGVRSVRTSLSLLIDVLQTRAAARPAGSAGRERLVTVSWFPENDAAAAGAVWLHHGQEVLAERFDLLWESASDSPPGGSAAIRDALVDGSAVKLLTVCGHGNLYGPGVRLKDDEVWTGRGCDFDKVDWLLLVSCSLGRVRHTGVAGDAGDEGEAPDVEGFIAHLLARRVRSVLACRWPVHGSQAARFANLAASAYLAADDSRTESSRRAAALNSARARVLGNGSSHGINTVAAFEIYGQG